MRIAIVGAGPAGFYTAAHLLRQSEFDVRVDMFERLPAPFGLVRYGVAPDHQKDKSVTRAFDKTAADERFRFFGNVDFGTDIDLGVLQTYYHQLVFCTGAAGDRTLGIDGENLSGSHAAAEFVAWYNGHPDYTERQFDLSCERAVVIGVGNVALDVARILLSPIEQLARTDIADYALDALRRSRVREVVLLGRRGPAQASFTPAELREFSDLSGVRAWVPAAEAGLDQITQSVLTPGSDKTVDKNLDLLQRFASNPPAGGAKQITFRFFVSPVSLQADEGRLSGLSLVRNEPYLDDDQVVRVRATEQRESITAGLVFRSVGYRGGPLADVPFDEAHATLPHRDGRVVDEHGSPLPGIYAAGWIKRGPDGVIGTNKTCARDTVASMLADAREVDFDQRSDIHGWLARAGVDAVSYAAWRRIDEIESRMGAERNRPRVKLTTRDALLAAARS